jgi:hypothetical protein
MSHKELKLLWCPESWCTSTDINAVEWLWCPTQRDEFIKARIKLREARL